MTALLRRIAGAFVAPPDVLDEAGGPAPALFAPATRSSSTSVGRRPAAPVATPPAPVPPAAESVVAVVCAARDTALAGAAVGLALAERLGARCAVVLEWSGAEEPALVSRPAMRAARRAAARLVDAELEPGCCGRLVRVPLPRDEREAVRAAERAIAVTSDAAVVLVAGGPRGEAMEALLAERTALVLAVRPDHDETLLELATAELEALARPVTTAALPPSPVAAGLARAGVALVSPLRAPMLAALD